MASMMIRIGADLVLYGFSDALLEEYTRYFLQMFIAQNSASVVNTPLWFVPCLFAVGSIYYFISKLRPAMTCLVCCVLVCVGWLLESEHVVTDGVIIPWSLDSGLFAIGFYAIGNLLFDKVKYLISRIEESGYTDLIAAGGALGCALVLAPVAQLNGMVSLGSKSLNNGVLFYLTGLIGTVGVLFAAVLLRKSKALRYCGQNSFCIMSTHIIIRNIYIGCCGLLGLAEYDEKKLSETVLPFLVVLVLSLICTFVYNKLRTLSIAR